jgi:predicted deacylase
MAGVRPGPVVGMTSSLHGDEVNGVRVIHRLFQNELNPTELHGTVVAVVVANLQGFLAGTRGMDGQDLNRLMPGLLLCLPLDLTKLGKQTDLLHSSMLTIFYTDSSKSLNI